MGMFDSFYFAEGVLPDNREAPDKEFQGKDLCCSLDIYKVDHEYNITIASFMSMSGESQKVGDSLEPIEVYSHEFIYDKPDDIFNRKLLKVKYQLYSFRIKDSKISDIKKIEESGYDSISGSGNT